MKFYFRVYIYGLGELADHKEGEAESQREMVEKIRVELLANGFQGKESAYISFYNDEVRTRIIGLEKISPLLARDIDEKAQIFNAYYSELMGEWQKYYFDKLSNTDDFSELIRWVIGKFTHLKSEIEWNKKN